MLLLGLLASAYEGNLFYIDVSKSYGNCLCGQLCPEQLSSCLTSYKKLTVRQKQALKTKYDTLPHEYPCIKRYVHRNFEVVKKEILKKKLLRHVTTKPQSWRIPIYKAMGKSRLGEFYSSTFWECLTLELLSEGQGVISEMIFKPKEGCPFPVGTCKTTPYLYNGFDLRKLYSFKYFKTK